MSGSESSKVLHDSCGDFLQRGLNVFLVLISLHAL